MQRSASDIFWELLVSGEHSLLFERLDHFDAMEHPYEEGKIVHPLESSHIDDAVDSTMSAIGMSMPFAHLHAPLHLSTKVDAVTNLHRTKKTARKSKWRKPKDMPKRPLSAYNIFFQNERKKLAGEKSANDAKGTSSTSMGFAGLAQNVARKWKSLDSLSRAYYEAEAGKDQVRYRQEVDVWKRRKDERQVQDIESNADSPSPCLQGIPASKPAPALSQWPSMPQTIESLGNLYDANVDRLAVQYDTKTSTSRRSQQQQQQEEESIVAESLEPLPINPTHENDARTSSFAGTVTVGSLLHQLYTGMEEEELDFLMSLRDLK